MYQEGRAIYLQVGRCCNVSGMYCKLLDEDVCKIARTSFKGLEEDVATSCMEHGGRAAQKMSQCSRNVLQVTRRGCYNVSGTSGKLFEEELTTYKERRASYLLAGRCCNVSGTSAKLFDDIQEHHSIYLNKM